MTTIFELMEEAEYFVLIWLWKDHKVRTKLDAYMDFNITAFPHLIFAYQLFLTNLARKNL